MQKRIAAAIIGGATLVGSGAILTQSGGANAEVITVTVCNRQRVNSIGNWECVEYTTCLVDHIGNYVCDDNNRWIGPSYGNV